MKKNTIISFFSEETNRFYKLSKTDDWPCLEFSGIRMHCTKMGVKKSTHQMISQLRPLQGICLDTCAGLGYTTIEMAKQGATEKVYCFEIDKNVIEIAKQNSFSKGLFENKKIELRNEDVIEGLKEFPDKFFDRILHDPPRISIAGDLYSREFYRELFRVLKPEGILFHHTGMPFQKSGTDFIKSTMKRLEEIGFKKILRRENAQGVLATK
jgi:hypothetical protein